MHNNRITFLFHACVLGFVFSACGEAEDMELSVTDEEIVGGRNAQPGEFPWMTALLDSSGQFCGGSLIRNRWVVTASHCVIGLVPADVYVGIGELRISNLDAADTAAVVRIVLHPQYNANTDDNDIALLELAESFANIPKVRMLAANEEDTRAAPGRTATAIGWGSTRQGGNVVDRLRKVDVPIVGRARCRNQYQPEGFPITGRMICAGDMENGGEDTCQGDSGGPLVVGRGNNMALAGVTSFGIGCARRRYPGVYANVARLSAWADRCINGDCN